MYSTKKLIGCIVGVLLLLTILPLTAYAEVPQRMSYQGYLTDPAGNPVADGSYTMIFAIYDVAVGGTELWSESQAVTVTNGVYNIILGQPGNELDPAAFDGDLYLGVTVESDAEMTPRQKLTSTAFAMKSANADDADTLDGIDSTVLDQSAHVGDTSNPHSVTAAQAGAATMSDIAWGNLSGIPVDIADGDDVGITSETDPTVISSVKDGVAWGELSAIPAGFADGVDNVGLTSESDYGRSGVSTTLYEGTTALTDKYVNVTGDSMTGALTLPANGLVAGTDQLVISGGNVGIGMVSPGYTLDVDGDINTSGVLMMDETTVLEVDSTYYNTFLGINAGQANTTGNYNTFLGYNAGYSNTTGYWNMFLGYNAGSANTAGYGNTFLGNSAGSSNTTGNNNAFLGTSSGYSNTTGFNNTFVGFDVGTYNTTGFDNTFLGYHSGYYNTTGGRNTFLGKDAGYSNTEAYDNTFLGWAAGLSNTTGQTNTFLGRSAGHYNTTGNNNTFAGYYAGLSNTTGYFNTFLGTSSGYSNTTGFNNTFVGINAGRSNSTGWGNVFIGYQAGYNETASNKLYIDSSNTSSPLIYGEFDNDILVFNGNVGIGTTPAEKLTVEGAGSNPIIKGTNTDTGNFGYFGSSDYGVYGRHNSTGNYGFLGSQNFGGVHGYSTQSIGVYGLTTSGYGVAGSSTTNGIGVYGSSVNDKGVVGYGGSYDFYASGPGENYGSASSIRWKKNIREIDNALDKIMKIRGVYFDWDEEHGGDHDMGFIAEEVGEYIPEIVSYEEDSIYATGMDYGAITPVLLQAIKELSEQNKELRAEIEALKEQYGKLNMAMAEKLNWTVSKDRVSSDYQLKAELFQ